MRSRTIGWAAIGTAVVLAMGAVIAAACGSTGTGYSSSNSTLASQSTATVRTGSSTTIGSSGSSAYGGGYYGTANSGTGDTSGGGASGVASVKVGDTTLGKVLTDAEGMTLYTFGNDVTGSGKSVCNGGCATNWPPLTIASGTPGKADGLTGDLTVITRDDGSKQVAYKGMPLYRYAPDKAPGDTKGQGVGNVWYLATP